MGRFVTPKLQGLDYYPGQYTQDYQDLIEKKLTIDRLSPRQKETCAA